jgi:Ca2+-binding EF-hand superfamily protein
MALVFKIFDFDNDGKISADEISLILSYIPFNSKQP